MFHLLVGAQFHGKWKFPMDDIIKAAVVDIESTTDLLERALKLAGLLSSMFQKHGFPLVVVGGSAVEMRTLRAEIENG